MFIKKVISTIPKSVLDTCKNNLTASKSMSPELISEYAKIRIKKPASVYFQKSESVTGHELARIRCLSELWGKNPREAVCIVDKKSGKLLASALGDAENCAFELGVNGLKGRDLILYHGHTSVGSKGATLPVSLQDFIVMNDSNIEKIVAFNSKGKQSYLKKNPDFIPLKSREMIQLKNKYRKALLVGSSTSDTVKIKELIQYVQQHPEARGVKMEIVERLNDLQKKDTAKDIIDRFWRQNACNYKLTYFSEF